MRLSHLLEALYPKTASKFKSPSADQSAAQPWVDGSFGMDLDIGSIHYRAQEVQPNGLFVAIPGLAADGHDFIGEAVNRGAALILSQKPVQSEAPVIQVENTRKALAALAAQFYQNPSQKLFIIGITGTNGKTTTTYLVESVLKKAGFATGVIGTVNYRYAGKVFPSANTTPEALDLQSILNDMLCEGITHVIMEVSSHAIDLNRIDYCWMDVGVFTNLSQDHLDYHKEMDQYWNCKKRLFSEHLVSGPKANRAQTVINGDDVRGRELIGELPLDGLTFGYSDHLNISAHKLQYDLRGISGSIKTPAGVFDIKTTLLGRHNAENILCATGVGLALDLSPDIIQSGIETQTAIPGRLERIPDTHGRFVFVDYAHTPDALKNVLSTLKSMAPGKIICIFGCGGDRDKQKRSPMGAIAGSFCDLAIITSDNPRTEDPLAIIHDITQGIRKTANNPYSHAQLRSRPQEKGYTIEPDRKRAIKLGINASKPNDIVLIAGKGHETYQIIGQESKPFDDRMMAIEALSSKPAKQARKVWLSNQNSDHPPAQAQPFPWNTAEILRATGGERVTGDKSRSFKGISIDSRRINPHDLFVAIKGSTHDGHTFISDVIAQGIRGVLIDKGRFAALPTAEWKAKGIFIIAVKDTTKALGDLAAFNRRRAGISAVAITGSNGKTTTRRMTSAVVSQRHRVLSPTGNFNNEIGLPLTLLKLNPLHQWAVLELGINRPGEISRLAEICAPQIGVITNIGPVHLEGLGSIEGVLQAKGELLGKLTADGVAILNGDDPSLVRLAQKANTPVLLFGLSGNASIRAHTIHGTRQGTAFILKSPQAEIAITLRIPGRFMVPNALAAAAVGHHLGLSLPEIKRGLERIKSVHGRMNIIKTKKGIHIIDDTYNANPKSMAAALETLVSFKGQQRAVFVAGDMLELGSYAETLHREVGRLAAQAGLERLYATGTHCKIVAEGARSQHMNPADIVTGDKDFIVDDLAGWLQSGDWVLVKGSRGMRMEQIVERLQAWGKTETADNN